MAPLTLVTDDGFPLAATRFKSVGPRRGVVLIAPATGVRQRFYRPFALYLMAQGWDVLTWDWRGVADSSHGVSPRDPRLTMNAWGERDLAAAIAWADRRASGGPVTLVGHSFGGQAVDLAPNADRLAAIALVASQHPWLGYWPRWQRPLLAALWHVVVPLLARLSGRLPLSAIGPGEDLPVGVALDWASRCRRRRGAGDWKGHGRLTAPVLAISFADDWVAPRRATEALLATFKAATVVTHHHVETGAHTTPAVGHFGFFREGQVPALWDQVTTFLAAAGMATPS